MLLFDTMETTPELNFWDLMLVEFQTKQDKGKDDTDRKHEKAESHEKVESRKAKHARTHEQRQRRKITWPKTEYPDHIKYYDDKNAKIHEMPDFMELKDKTFMQRRVDPDMDIAMYQFYKTHLSRASHIQFLIKACIYGKSKARATVRLTVNMPGPHFFPGR